jgi:hypothetical protein
VTLFCGAGCADAHAELIELARMLKVPIVHAFRGRNLSNTIPQGRWNDRSRWLFVGIRGYEELRRSAVAGYRRCVSGVLSRARENSAAGRAVRSRSAPSQLGLPYASAGISGHAHAGNGRIHEQRCQGDSYWSGITSFARAVASGIASRHTFPDSYRTRCEQHRSLLK